MESRTYIGSGWSETVIDIDSHWSEIITALEMTEHQYVKNFKHIVKLVYTEGESSWDHYAIAKTKEEIRILRTAIAELQKGFENPYHNYEEFWKWR